MPWSLCAGKLLPAPWEWLNSYSSLLAFREIREMRPFFMVCFHSLSLLFDFGSWYLWSWGQSDGSSIQELLLTIHGHCTGAPACGFMSPGAQWGCWHLSCRPSEPLSQIPN